MEKAGFKHRNRQEVNKVYLLQEDSIRNLYQETLSEELGEIGTGGNI